MIGSFTKDTGTNVCGFVADYVDDISSGKLPTLTHAGSEELENVAPVAQGSWCLIISSGDLYMLNGDGEWVLVGGDEDGDLV